MFINRHQHSECPVSTDSGTYTRPFTCYFIVMTVLSFYRGGRGQTQTALKPELESKAYGFSNAYEETFIFEYFLSPSISREIPHPALEIITLVSQKRIAYNQIALHRLQCVLTHLCKAARAEDSEVPVPHAGPELFLQIPPLCLSAGGGNRLSRTAVFIPMGWHVAVHSAFLPGGR